jgi:uncharacterized MAPEG superfamily protein
MAIQTFKVDSQAPWGGPRPVEDVLAPPRIANIELTITSTSIAQATAFRNALETIPGFASAVLSNTAVGTDGTVTTSIQLGLATDAVTGRFAEQDDDAATEED